MPGPREDATTRRPRPPATRAQASSIAALSATAFGKPWYTAKWATNSRISSIVMSPEPRAPATWIRSAWSALAAATLVSAIQRRSLRVRPGRVQISPKTWSTVSSASGLFAGTTGISNPFTSANTRWPRSRRSCS